jgi:hypothetical protein
VRSEQQLRRRRLAYRVDSAAVQNWILGVIGATEFAKIQFAS